MASSRSAHLTSPTSEPYKSVRVIAQELRQEPVDGSIGATDGTMRQKQPIVACLQHAILSLAPLGFK
ncbi:unnamed protein product [Fusarium graminearum]|uniref:Chromosome 4, complete genome n=1 Tax=Gibberella zeae (strain ATCC MYA-4620 / CBS 123657 / FGSC 9075 / NRRL 31084 / PH-1) TaxID=229533 RepID=A0A0E0SCC3_GIBZE|nr:hypothetical protein FG05_30581 [Fusarium graminearum]CEF84086.1 unnamed protein product [Fusarium graminearum]CZS73434.1 unnamed protein product [Fusarium graminearum]